MPAFHPAAKATSVELRSAGAVHVQVLCDSFLPTRDRHDDLEGRTRRKLRLNRFVQQRLVRVRNQLVPFVARDAYGKIVGIECRPAHHRQNFPGPRIHRDDCAILPFQRFLGCDL